MLPTKFRFIWRSGFREEDFLKSANQKQELPMAAMFVNGLELNEQSLQRTFHGFFLPIFYSFGQAVTEKIFYNSTNQKQELSVAAMFVNGSELNEHYLQRTIQGCYLPSFDSFGQAVSGEKNFFRNQPIRNKNCLWMSNRYREHAINASYQVSVHLAKRFQRRRFLKIGQSETRIAYGDHICQWIGTT